MSRRWLKTIVKKKVRVVQSWPVGPIISDTNAATNLQDRIKQANNMVKKTGLDIPVLIDTMDDLFGTAYAA